MWAIDAVAPMASTSALREVGTGKGSRRDILATVEQIDACLQIGPQTAWSVEESTHPRNLVP